jgi:hypothetical protein
LCSVGLRDWMDAGCFALAPSREVCGACGVGDAGVASCTGGAEYGGERVTYGNRLSRGRIGGV